MYIQTLFMSSSMITSFSTNTTWRHPSKLVNALVNCGRIKGLTPLLPNAHVTIERMHFNMFLLSMLRLRFYKNMSNT